MKPKESLIKGVGPLTTNGSSIAKDGVFKAEFPSEYFSSVLRVNVSSHGELRIPLQPPSIDDL